MTALTADAFAFRAQREPALGRSFTLAFLVHAVLIGVMFLGVRVQSRPPESVIVELVDLAPPPPAPVVVQPPPPAPEPPKVEPAPPPPPPVAKPDIAVQEKAKPKPKPKPVAKPEPKRDLKLERQQKQLMNEQLAAEQRAIVAQDAQRKERELQALIAKQQADVKAKALAAWTYEIQRKIRSRISVSAAEAVVGDPEAIFSVRLLPNGEVLGRPQMTKSSGNRAYDEAVERAILGSSPLPMPEDRSVFQRQLELRFRPKDKPGS